MGELLASDLNSIFNIVDEQLDEYPIFVETGTHKGNTVLGLHSYFSDLYTIELSVKYYSEFNAENPHLKIHTFLGDSSIVLLDIIPSLNGKAVFWLDGHFSSGDTAQGDKDCPLIEELSAIDKLYSFDKAVIIIDDYRLFGFVGNEDWSEITEDNILNCLNNFEVKHFVVKDRFVLKIERSKH